MASRTGRPWQRIKRRVVQRDRGICHLCRRPGATSADHIIPVAHGGAVYELSNLAAAHHKCNLIRGTRPIPEARARIAEELGHTITDSDAWTW